MCYHVYNIVGSDICPYCRKVTHEIDWSITHKLHKEWISSGKATLQGWWSI